MKWTIMFNDTYDRKNAASFIELMSSKEQWIRDRFGEISKIQVKKCWTLKNLKSFKDKTYWVYITMEGTEWQKEEVHDWLNWKQEHDTLDNTKDIFVPEEDTDLLPF